MLLLPCGENKQTADLSAKIRCLLFGYVNVCKNPAASVAAMAPSEAAVMIWRSILRRVSPAA